MYFRTDEHPDYLELWFLDEASSNAFSIGAARELASLVRKYRKFDRPVVVRSMHPRLFCSGGQLSDYARLKNKAAGVKINREITAALDALGAWPVAKLAVIEGDVFGGGLEWLARFDTRWSVPSALFGFWQSKIGLSYGWGGGRAWAARVGEARAREWLLEGATFGSAQALREGVIDRVITSWNISEDVSAWARDRRANDSSLRAWSVRRESSLFARLWMGPRHRAALTKWLARGPNRAD